MEEFLLGGHIRLVTLGALPMLFGMTAHLQIGLTYNRFSNLSFMLKHFLFGNIPQLIH